MACQVAGAILIAKPICLEVTPEQTLAGEAAAVHTTARTTMAVKVALE